MKDEHGQAERIILTDKYLAKKEPDEQGFYELWGMLWTPLEQRTHGHHSYWLMGRVHEKGDV